MFTSHNNKRLLDIVNHALHHKLKKKSELFNKRERSEQSERLANTSEASRVPKPREVDCQNNCYLQMMPINTFRVDPTNNTFWLLITRYLQSFIESERFKRDVHSKERCE